MTIESFLCQDSRMLLLTKTPLNTLQRLTDNDQVQYRLCHLAFRVLFNIAAAQISGDLFKCIFHICQSKPTCCSSNMNHVFCFILFFVTLTSSVAPMFILTANKHLLNSNKVAYIICWACKINKTESCHEGGNYPVTRYS